MDRSKKWENIIKSGSYNRNVKRYSEMDESSDSGLLNPSDTPDTLLNTPSTSTYALPTSSSSQDAPVPPLDTPSIPPLNNDDDVLDTSEDAEPLEEEYYSPDDESDGHDRIIEVESDLSSFLRQWSLEFKVSHSALKPLLTRLSQYDRMLPADPRRLLETPRETARIIEIQGGQYWHQGFETCLREAFINLKNSREISININIDGLPLFKNGTDQVWPILFNVHEEPHIKPMIIGIFHGKIKPKRVEEYLEPFVDEALGILNTGIVINSFILKVKIRAFICDSPARAFINGTVNFNAFHGCLKCTTVGERQKDLNVNTYPIKSAPKRTDAGFRSKIYDGHYQTYKTRENGKLKMVYVNTPLLRLPIDMVEDVIVSDSLHLLHLGVTKKMLTLFKDGHKYNQKWSSETVSAIDKVLSTIKLPLEIHRQVRGLHYLSHWKGSECSTFLNYVGIAILSEFISKEHYENFSNLFCAVTICSCDYYKTYLPVAQILFEHFVENFSKYFKSVSSNQHNLVHVVDEVRRFGALNTISSYPFESHLYQIKQLVRSGRLPLNQIINRITENQRKRYTKDEISKYPVLEHPSKEDAATFLRIMVSDGFTLLNSFSDKWFLTTNKNIVAMVHANVNGIMGTGLTHSVVQFKSPLTSFDLNVMCTNDDNSFLPCKLYSLTDIFCKLVAIPINDKTVFVPLHHTLPKL